MFGEFPVTHSFRAALFAGVYMPGRSLPAEVRFEGDLCLRFDATENANLLAISVESLSLQVVPCLLPLPESFGGSCVELRDVKITDEVVDLDASKGHLDLATGRSSMTWVLELEPARIPLMAQQGAKPFRIEFQDRGSFDARTGSYEMHHGMMEITEGPLAGALIRGSTSGEINSGGASTITLSVAVASAGAACESLQQDEVWICPGDSVLLCWTASSDVGTVDISPGGFTGLDPDSHQIVRPMDVGDHEYTATTVGGYTTASDSVKVHVMSGRDAIPFSATPNAATNRWECYVSEHSHSARLVAEELEILSDPHCLDWKRLTVEHLPHFGGFAVNGFGNYRLTFPAPVAGWWYFYAAPDPGYGSGQTPYPEGAGPICFRLRGHCR